MGTLAGKGHYDAAGHTSDWTPPIPSSAPAASAGARLALHVDDFTIKAGSSEGTIADKWIYIERLAYQLRMPLVRLVDSAGGSVKLLMQIGGTKIPEYTTWPAHDLLQTVPVVGVALGACAGQGAIKVLSSHFSVMVREQAQVMAAGPHVVRQAYGVDVDKNDLGGCKAHRKSALVHNEAVDEADALARVRRFLSYLPRSVLRVGTGAGQRRRPEPRRRQAEGRDPARPPQDLRSAQAAGVGLRPGRLFEIGRWQGGSVMTMLGRLNGVPVGVIANDPKAQGGAMTLQAAYKMERHIRLCEPVRPAGGELRRPAGQCHRAGGRASPARCSARHAWARPGPPAAHRGCRS